jgi:hypothetical protein
MPAPADAGAPVQIQFTGASDSPTVNNQNAGMAMAGNGDRFAVAWTDGQTCPGCSASEIYLTVVLAAGARPFGEVRVSTENANANPKAHPRVVWDGRSYVVAWVESIAGVGAVYLQRYDATLKPIAPLVPVSMNAPTAPLVQEIGLAAVAPDEYGVAFHLSGSLQQYLVHVKCSGP